MGAPAPGDAFFYSVRVDRGKTALRLAQRGSCEEVTRFDGVISKPLRTVMDGRVLFGLNRYGEPKSPVLGVFHPESSELTFVPPHMLGFRKDDNAEAYGVSESGKGAFLWVLDDEELRRISWDAILALPPLSAPRAV